MGIEELGMVGGDDELRFAEHIEGPSAGDPVDRGNDRLPQIATLRADVPPRIVEVVLGRSHEAMLLTKRLGFFRTYLGFEPIEARAECPLPRAGQHDGTNVSVGPQTSPYIAKLDLHLPVERVESLGAVEGDPCDTVTLLVQERLILSFPHALVHLANLRVRSGRNNRALSLAHQRAGQG